LQLVFVSSISTLWTHGISDLADLIKQADFTFFRCFSKHSPALQENSLSGLRLWCACYCGLRQPTRLNLNCWTLGDRHRLSDFRGKWVVINFWATWCGPCLKEIPELITFQSRYRSEVVVVGVNFENTPLADVKEFVASSGINYLVLRIGKEPLIPFEPLKGLPSTFLVSPEAEYLDVVVGAVTVAELEDLIVQHRGRTAHSAETV
jgi:thiol-disulfide isomerase/thioredoxin